MTRNLYVIMVEYHGFQELLYLDRESRKHIITSNLKLEMLKDMQYKFTFDEATELINRLGLVDYYDNVFLRITGDDLKLSFGHSIDTKIRLTNTAKRLDVIREWGNLKAREFPNEWTEDDELVYRYFYGTPLMMLPDDHDAEGS